MTHTELKQKGFKLVMLGDGNFNYYLDHELHCIWYFSKNKHCGHGIFGNIEYFKRWVSQQYKKNPKITGRLTALGFKITGLNP